MAKGRVIIDETRCKGCTLCTTVCSPKLLAIDEQHLNSRGYHPVVFSDLQGQCTGCGLCAMICPDWCFIVYREEKQSIHAATV